MDYAKMDNAALADLIQTGRKQLGELPSARRAEIAKFVEKLSSERLVVRSFHAEAKAISKPKKKGPKNASKK